MSTTARAKTMLERVAMAIYAAHKAPAEVIGTLSLSGRSCLGSISLLLLCL